MSQTPLERLIATGEARRVGKAELTDFAGAPGAAALLFTGDPAARPEAQDIAVIARELARGAQGALRLGVVDAAAEDALKLEFAVSAVPAVVFFRDGRAVTTLTRLQDWSVYAAAAKALLTPEAA